MQTADTDGSMDFIESLCGEFEKHNRIDPAYYERYDVKRGLRNADGTGVMAGVTQIGNVLGYYVQDGERFPMRRQAHLPGHRRGRAGRRLCERGPLRL